MEDDVRRFQRKQDIDGREDKVVENGQEEGGEGGREEEGERFAQDEVELVKDYA